MIGNQRVFPHNGTRSQAVIFGDLLYVPTCNGMEWTHTKIPSPDAPSLIVLNKHTGELVAKDDARISPNIFHSQWSCPSTGKVGERQLICLDATTMGANATQSIRRRSKAHHRSLSPVSITPEGLLFIADFSGFLHCLDADTGKSFPPCPIPPPRPNTPATLEAVAVGL